MIRGIILAGGTGSRLFPLTKVTNKHLLPVGRYPMIYHPIAKLKDAGITDICIVTGREHMGDVVSLLGSGAQWGLSFTYRVQDQAGGIAEALLLCEHFAQGGRVCVILGDNIFEDPLGPLVEAYQQSGRRAMVVLKEVDKPQRFGVARFEGEELVEIVEKPAEPPSNLAVTGIYFYDHYAFEVAASLEPSARGELEITDVNNAYLRLGELAWTRLSGWWTDAGTFESYPRANQLARDVVLSLEG